METIKYKNAIIIIQYQSEHKSKYREGYVCFIELLNANKDFNLGYYDTKDIAVQAGKEFVDKLPRIKKSTSKKKTRKKNENA